MQWKHFWWYELVSLHQFAFGFWRYSSTFLLCAPNKRDAVWTSSQRCALVHPDLMVYKASLPSLYGWFVFYCFDAYPHDTGERSKAEETAWQVVSNIFLILKMHLLFFYFEVRDMERQSQRHTFWGLFHVLVHSTNASASQGWSRRQPGALKCSLAFPYTW